MANRPTSLPEGGFGQMVAEPVAPAPLTAETFGDASGTLRQWDSVKKLAQQGVEFKRNMDLAADDSLLNKKAADYRLFEATARSDMEQRVAKGEITREDAEQQYRQGIDTTRDQMFNQDQFKTQDGRRAAEKNGVSLSSSLLNDTEKTIFTKWKMQDIQINWTTSMSNDTQQAVILGTQSAVTEQARRLNILKTSPALVTAFGVEGAKSMVDQQMTTLIANSWEQLAKNDPASAINQVQDPNSYYNQMLVYTNRPDLKQKLDGRVKEIRNQQMAKLDDAMARGRDHFTDGTAISPDAVDAGQRTYDPKGENLVQKREAEKYRLQYNNAGDLQKYQYMSDPRQRQELDFARREYQADPTNLEKRTKVEEFQKEDVKRITASREGQVMKYEASIDQGHAATPVSPYSSDPVAKQQWNEFVATVHERRRIAVDNMRDAIPMYDVDAVKEVIHKLKADAENKGEKLGSGALTKGLRTEFDIILRSHNLSPKVLAAQKAAMERQFTIATDGVVGTIAGLTDVGLELSNRGEENAKNTYGGQNGQ